MPTRNYSAMTKNELESFLKNATRLSEVPSDITTSSEAKCAIEEVNKELSKRNNLKLKANKKTGDSFGFMWKKRDHYTNTLFHNGEIVGDIKLVANHSLSNRDVYDAYVFGRHFRMFEYIVPAKDAVREKVEQELARGGGQPRGNDDPRGSGSSS